MGYQFIHVESYGRTAGKGKRSEHTIDTVAAEADRIEGNVYHVENPQAPVIHFGVSFREAAEIARKWADEAKDSRKEKPHKLRKDALCMVAGVISAPDDLADWDSFRDDSITWLKEKYGTSLRAVIEHIDENHRHIHFAAVANEGERFATIHQGYAAQSAATKRRGDRSVSAEQKKNDRKAGRVAYADAMREFQAEFSERVGLKHGLLRYGPKKRRLTRAEWHIEQGQLKELAARQSVVADQEKSVEIERGKLQVRKESLDKLSAKHIEASKQIAIQRGKAEQAMAFVKQNVPEKELDMMMFKSGIFYGVPKDRFGEVWGEAAKMAQKIRDEVAASRHQAAREQNRNIGPDTHKAGF